MLSPCMLWDGSKWIRALSDASGRQIVSVYGNVNVTGSYATLGVSVYPTAGAHNVSVQNWPGNQPVTPYPNNWSTVTYTGNGVVKAGATYLHWFAISNGNASQEWVRLRNGSLVTSPILFDFICEPSKSFPYAFFPAGYFSSGLYIEFSTGSMRATLGYY